MHKVPQQHEAPVAQSIDFLDYALPVGTELLGPLPRKRAVYVRV